MNCNSDIDVSAIKIDLIRTQVRTYQVKLNEQVQENNRMKAEIEKNVNEKFCGSSNAGRVLINFANGKDNATTLEKLDVQDFGEKYKAAAERAKNQIFTAFRAIPQLFGDMTAATGFNSQEFTESFKVFNRTVCQPIQKTICDSIDKIFNNKNSVEITPFSLEDNKKTNKII